MFCMECGTKLPDNAKFCFNCGNKISGDISPVSSSLENNKNTETIIERTSMALPDVAEIYNDIFSIAEKKSHSFVDNMYYDFDTLNVFCDRGFLAIKDLFASAEAYTLDLLHRYGVYHFSDKDIFPYTRKYMGNTSDVLSGLLSEYQQIKEDGEEIAAYNEYLKQNRSYFVGGGFGLSGAVKGIATAGALNATTGVFRSYADKRRSDALHAEIADRKYALYHDDKFRRALQFSIELDLKESIHGICDLFSDYDLPTIPYYPINNLMQAGNILDAVCNGSVPNQDFEKVAYQIISLYPVHRDMYLYATDICPDQKHNFFSMASNYGMDLYEYHRQLDCTAAQYAKKLTENRIFQYAVKNSVLKDSLSESIEFWGNAFHNCFDDNFSICAGRENKYSKHLDRIHRIYARYSLDTETPILFVDDSDHASYRHGMLLTNQYIYARADRWQVTFPINSIKSFTIIKEQANKYLRISTAEDERDLPIQIRDFNENLMLDLLNYFINYCLYIENTSDIHVISKPTIDDFKSRIFSLSGITDLPQANIADNTTAPFNAETITTQIEQAILAHKKMPPYYGKTIRKASDTTFSMLNRDLTVMKEIFPSAFNSDELLLYYYDRTILGTGAESFLMTNKYFYCHSEKHGSWKIAYKNISSISVARNFWSELEINGRIVPLSVSSDDQDFASDLEHFFVPIILKFSECSPSCTESEVLLSDTLRNNNDSRPEPDDYVTTCPECEKEICFGKATLDKGEMTCPYCGEIICFDEDEDYEDSEDDDDNDEQGKGLNRDIENPDITPPLSRTNESSNVVEQIYILCKQFLSTHDQRNYRVEQNLLIGLNINTQEIVFLGHDDTMLRSGKNGFAITSAGIHCCDMFSNPVFTSYADLSKASSIYKKSTYIYADQLLLAYVGINRQDIPDLLVLFQSIYSLLHQHGI